MTLEFEGATRRLVLKLTADGSTDAITWRGDGTGEIHLRGVLGNGTLKMEISEDGGTSWDDAGAEGYMTAAGIKRFKLLGQKLIRLTLTGSTLPDTTIYLMRD